MPTGYTHMIGEGASFEEFALETARAFGALIHLRDEGKVTMEKILEKPEESSYHKNRIQEAEKELEEFLATDVEELQNQWEVSRQARIDGLMNDIRKREELKRKYESMLERVERYVPPTPEHVGHKKFMKEQIEDSIKFDCSGGYCERYIIEIEEEKFHEWYEAKLKTLRDTIEYNKEALEKELKTNSERHQWVVQLAKAVKDVT